MTDALWQEFYEAMVKEDIYPVRLNYRDAYTLQFVNRSYGSNLVQQDTQPQPPPQP